MTTTITIPQQHDVRRRAMGGVVRLRNQRCTNSEPGTNNSDSSSTVNTYSSMYSCLVNKRRTLSQQQPQQHKQGYPPTMTRKMLSSFAIMVISIIALMTTNPVTAAAQETVLVFNEVKVTISSGLPPPPVPRDETVAATEVTFSAATTTKKNTAAKRQRQAVDGNGLAEPKRRVRVSPFLISLVQTPAPLQPYEYDELYSIIQQLLNDYIADKTHEVALKDLENIISTMSATATTSSSATTTTAQMSADTTSEYLSLTYVLLTDIDGVYSAGEPGESSTTLTMGEGVAAFYAPGQNGAGAMNVPSEELVDDWVRQAIDTELVQKLATTKYGYVQQATYVSLDQQDDGNNDNTNAGGGGGGEEGEDDVSEVVSPREAETSNNGDGGPAMSVGLVAGVACAAALTLVVIAFLVGKSRQTKNARGGLQQYGASSSASGVSGSSAENDPALMLDGTSRSRSRGPKAIPPGRAYKLDDIMDDDDLDVDMLDDEEEQTNTCLTIGGGKKRMSPVTAATMAVARATSELECRSMAEMSDSDFTVSTEAGDSAALKSIGGGGGGGVAGYAGGLSFFARGGGSGNSNMMTVPPMVTAESFEHDRQVSLRKDMLTSPWSGRMPSIRTSQQESVLQPSHFTASQERRLRQTINNIDFDQETGRGGWKTSSSSLGGGGVGDDDDDVVGVSGSGSGGNGGGDAPFIFRPHTQDVGEEIFIMRGSGGQRETELL
jgi:hypothetical protein